MIGLASLFLVSVAIEPAAQQEQCSYDPEILSMDFEKFDQDEDSGWRQVARQPGCEKEAAKLIRIYRLNMEQRLSVLYFHEGQMKAFAEDYPEAISALRQSMKKQDVFGWNPYVRATIAFLQRDIDQLKKERDILNQTVRPNSWEGDWPLNLDVIDALIRCFKKSYKEAYSSNSCSK